MLPPQPSGFFVRSIQFLLHHFSLNIVECLRECLHELLALHFLQRPPYICDIVSI